MSVASEIHTSLRMMNFVQLLLVIAFIGCYAVACSGLFETRGRLRAAAAVLLLWIAFATLTDPWVNGALIMAGVVGAMGLFVATVWATSAALRLTGPGPTVVVDTAPAAEPIMLATPQPPRRGEPHAA